MIPISKEQTLKALLDQCKITGYGGLTPNDVLHVMTYVVKPIEGEWVFSEEDGWYCSNCKALLETDEFVSHYHQYCYHCGALMHTRTLEEEVKEKME